MVLDISNLKFGYSKEKLIFDNFSLSLNQKEVVCLVGASGSGKSTLLELICGFMKPFAGTIVAQKTAMVYQDPYSSFHPMHPILTQIQDVCGDISALDGYLQKIKLDKTLLTKKPYELSGGQLQRCSILRAVLQKPKLLLADEPTSALDNIVALDVMQLLLSFLPECGILIVTHDLDMARWCSDTIIRLEKK